MLQTPPTKTSNREYETTLEDGPENAWFGHYSLSEQGKDVGPDFAAYIENNKPVWFTDPKVINLLSSYMTGNGEPDWERDWDRDSGNRTWGTRHRK